MNTKCGRGANAAGFHGASPLCAMSRGLGTRCDARSGQVCFCVALGFQKHQQMPFLVTLLLMHCCHCPHQSHPFLYMCKLVFQTGSRHSQLFPFPSLRFQVQEMDITLDILRIKKSIQGIGCLQSRWEELEGQAARLGLQRPWKQLELAHPGNWHFCPPPPPVRKTGTQKPPPDLLALQMYPTSHQEAATTTDSETSYQSSQNRLPDIETLLLEKSMST